MCISLDNQDGKRFTYSQIDSIPNGNPGFRNIVTIRWRSIGGAMSSKSLASEDGMTTIFAKGLLTFDLL